VILSEGLCYHTYLESGPLLIITANFDRKFN